MRDALPSWRALTRHPSPRAPRPSPFTSSPRTSPATPRTPQAELASIPARLSALSLDDVCRRRLALFDVYHRYLKGPAQWEAAISEVIRLHRRKQQAKAELHAQQAASRAAQATSQRWAACPRLTAWRRPACQREARRR